jgi:hypothetical protein
MAAHKSLKFGSKVRVTNKSNANSATVTITDRGPLCERSLHRSDEGRGARPWIIARVETFPLARPMGFSRVPSRSSVLRFGSDFQKSGCSCLHRTVSEPNKIVVRRSKRGATADQGRALLPNLDAIVLERSWAGEVLPHLDHTALGANPILYRGIVDG